MTRPYEPLTDEERQLASRLDKLGPRGEPSPALDARILAAAQAAVAATPAARRKPRWPVALGLAASAVLAVGVAWQLRPLQENAFERQAPAAAPPASAQAPITAIEERETAAEADVAVTSTEVPAPAAEAPAAAISARPLPPPTQPRADTVRTTPAVPRQAPSAPAPVISQATESAPETDAYSPPPPPPPPALPAPPPLVAAPPAPQSAPMADSEAAMKFTADPEQVVVTGARMMTTRESAARAEASRQAKAERQARRASEIRNLAGPPAAAAPALDSIPVAQDAALSIEDWLQRIRERRDSGALQAARDSLQDFVEAHPEHLLPDDLRPLLDPP